jgi:pSer/pThr/pTyr-binding forkhead associated (FHA) protein/tetratricopeptide (TPR) repeat protein
MHKLTIEDDEGKTVVVPLIRDEITVGRQEGNSIRLTERNISRRHARFFRQGGNLFVEDLGSYTGIKVSGARITAPTLLKDGDLVVIGDYKLTVRTDRPVATKLYGGVVPFGPGTSAQASTDAPRPLTLVPGINPVIAARNAPAPVATAPLPMPGSSAGGAASAVPLQSPAPGATSTGFAASGAAQASFTSADMGVAPAPEATLDAAPTIPVRTLAEQGLNPDGPPPARLVVTATNLAGAEFALDRPSLVIGRTPENDIVLNHKSISRHHAKIIRDGEKYIVVDLESANGVRVNGAEFERVELQSGDTLELGHVRMKFTSGNEFVDFEVAAGGSNRRRMMIFGAIGAVALAGVVMTFSSSSPRIPAIPAAPPAAPVAAAPAPEPVNPASPAAAPTGEPKVTAPVPGTTAAPTPPAGPSASTPAPAPATPTPETPAPAAAGPDIAKLMTETKSAMTRRKWDDALERLNKILVASPASTEAMELKRKAEAEKATAQKYIRLEEASRDKASYEEALQLFGEIPEDSIYKSRAQPIKDLTQKRLIALRLTEIEQMVNRGECEEARHQAERVLTLDPASERAKSLPDRCDRIASQKIQREAEKAARPAVVARDVTPLAPPRPAPAPRPAQVEAPAHVPEARPATPRPAPEPRIATPRPPPVEAKAVTPPETGDPEVLLQEATQAWLRGQFAAAIESARRALRVRPNLPKAYQIIAVCSCSLRDADGATKAYERLDERMKPLVKSACQKSNIMLN